ncbi:hypothetical protein [Paenibacillus sp. Marseille-Q9583]
MNLSSSDIIAITNALATLALSIFVYRATKKSADATVETTRLTEESLKLNQQIMEQAQAEKRNLRRALRIQYIGVLGKIASDLLNGVTTSDITKLVTAVNKSDYQHNISAENLAVAFSPHEMKIINKAWYALNIYFEKYKLAAYDGNEAGQLVTHAPDIIIPFEEVKHLIEDIRTNEEMY